MNTLLISTLIVAIPVYAMVWHNQPARAQKEKTIATKSAVPFLLNPTWLTLIAALAARWVASHIPQKWQTAKIHAQRWAKI